jgi:diguanylate cyclase (GGDEF)-like protein/PAS domain S-box-containing protein
MRYEAGGLLEMSEARMQDKGLAPQAQVVQLAALATLLHAESGDCHRLLEIALPLVCRMFDAEAGWVFVSQRGSEYEVAARYGLEAAVADELTWEQCRCQRLQQADALEGCNIQTCERLAQLEIAPSGLRYHASLPFVIAGMGQGILNLVYPDERPFDDQQLELMASVIEVVGTALSQCQSSVVREEEALRSSQLQAHLLDQAPVAILAVDLDDRVVGWNVHAEALFGLSKAQVMGRAVSGLAIHHPDEAERDRIAGSLASGATWEACIVYQSNGREIPLCVSVSVVQSADAGFDGYVATFVDDSERVQHEEGVRRLAHTDALTGLPNRDLFLERLDAAVSDRTPLGPRIAVLCVNVDNFKVVNNSLGHLEGDKLLEQLAGRLERVVHAADTLARVSGDEFLVMRPEVSSSSEVDDLAQRILGAFAVPIATAAHQHHLTASIGVVVARTIEQDAEGLVDDAVTAMHEAKRRGQGLVQLFDEPLRLRSIRRHEIERDLRESIADGSFELHYQPQMSIADGRIVGVEALLRWRTPDGRLASPVEFMDIAESTGLIVPLGEWVMAEACRDIAGWQRTHPPGLRVSVNVSAVQIQRPDFLEMLKARMADAGVDASNIRIEITETAFVEMGTELIVRCQQMRELGVHLAVDDFGTGYSSLDYLRRLEPREIKVDLSFVRGLPEKPSECAIVEAIIGLGRSLEIDVVAEGVETPEQLECLVAMGCKFAQGYLWARPMPRLELTALLSQDRR